MTQSVRPFYSDFRQIAAAGKEYPALIDGRTDVVFSYKDVTGLISRYGGLFKAHGVGAGDCVLVLLPNCLENIICFLSTLNFGVAYAPLPVNAAPREIRRWCELVKPKLCLGSSEIDLATQEILAAMNIAHQSIAIGSTFDWLPASDLSLEPSSLVPGKLYITTSGSTGEPRAMVIDGDRLWSSARAFTRHHKFLNEGSRYLNNMPMSYLGGLFNLGLIPLATGGSTVITDQFSGRTFLNFWQTVERFEVNTLWLVPTMVRGLLAISQRTRRQEIAKLRGNIQAGFLGTAPINLATKISFEDVFNIPLLENFALSETTFFATETLDTRAQRTEGSVGQILPFADVKMVAVPADEDSDDGKALKEIYVRSPYLFLGYLEEDGSMDLPVDEDGFLATGDLGRIENDDTLVIEGRLRDIVKKGGFLVSLREAEDLAEQHEAVIESAAVPISNEFYGEDYVLFVRLRESQAEELASKDFRHWFHRNLMRHKWPSEIRIVEEFPRSATGKIRKHVLSRQITQGA